MSAIELSVPSPAWVKKHSSEALRPLIDDPDAAKLNRCEVLMWTFRNTLNPAYEPTWPETIGRLGLTPGWFVTSTSRNRATYQGGSW